MSTLERLMDEIEQGSCYDAIVWNVDTWLYDEEDPDTTSHQFSKWLQEQEAIAVTLNSLLRYRGSLLLTGRDNLLPTAAFVRPEDNLAAYEQGLNLNGDPVAMKSLARRFVADVLNLSEGDGFWHKRGNPEEVVHVHWGLDIDRAGFTGKAVADDKYVFAYGEDVEHLTIHGWCYGCELSETKVANITRQWINIDDLRDFVELIRTHRNIKPTGFVDLLPMLLHQIMPGGWFFKFEYIIKANHRLSTELGAIDHQKMYLLTNHPVPETSREANIGYVSSLDYVKVKFDVAAPSCLEYLLDKNGSHILCIGLDSYDMSTMRKIPNCKIVSV